MSLLHRYRTASECDYRPAQKHQHQASGKPHQMLWNQEAPFQKSERSRRIRKRIGEDTGCEYEKIKRFSENGIIMPK